MPRCAVVPVVTLTILTAAGCLITGCATAGPLRSFTEQGHPMVNGAGLAVLPGQPEDATAFVTNSSSDPVTLVSASIVPVKGFPVPVLRDVAVDTALNVIGVASNWPPGVPIRPYARARLPHGESRIVFAMSGDKTGANYAAAGLKIVYRFHGQTYDVIAWAAVIGCVTTRKEVDNPAECGNSIMHPVMTTVNKMAG
jgi:hypothetical protein